jgi:hypothetical protein
MLLWACVVACRRRVVNDTLITSAQDYGATSAADEAQLAVRALASRAPFEPVTYVGAQAPRFAPSRPSTNPR